MGDETKECKCGLCLDQILTLQKALRESDGALTQLREAARYALRAIEPVARTGQVSQGGEQSGNRMDLEWARDHLKEALTQTEGKPNG